ncbi:hypothetical protein PZA11_003822 [Diplocarpon coronariae]
MASFFDVRRNSHSGKSPQCGKISTSTRAQKIKRNLALRVYLKYLWLRTRKAAKFLPVLRQRGTSVPMEGFSLATGFF